MSRYDRSESNQRRIAWLVLACAFAVFLLAITFAVSSAAPFRPLDNSYLRAVDTVVVEFPPYPTPLACDNGKYRGSDPTCPMYISERGTVTSQNGQVGIPVVNAGSLDGSQGPTLLIAFTVLSVGSLGLLLYVVDLFIIRRGR